MALRRAQPRCNGREANDMKLKTGGRRLFGVVIEPKRCAKHGEYASTILYFGSQATHSGCPICRGENGKQKARRLLRAPA